VRAVDMVTSKTKVSLIVCTLGDPVVFNFLDSIVVHPAIELEVFLVLQQGADSFGEALKKYHFSIREIAGCHGLSEGRNLALLQADGDWVGFPDDDCIYPNDLFDKLIAIWNAEPQWHLILATHYGINSRKIAKGYARIRCQVDKKLALRGTVVSFGIFINRPGLELTGTFNELLGVGSPGLCQACEEVEFVARAASSGCLCLYQPNLWVYHPESADVSSASLQKRFLKAFCYEVAHGWLLRDLDFPKSENVRIVVRGLLAFALTVIKFQHSAATVALGRVCGRVVGGIMFPEVFYTKRQKAPSVESSSL